jgi:hypothetical protein
VSTLGTALQRGGTYYATRCECRLNKIAFKSRARRSPEPQLRGVASRERFLDTERRGNLPRTRRRRLPKLLSSPVYFVPALTFAHRARCAAAILFLPAADMVRLGFGARPFAFAHRACCASAILRREAEDTIRVDRPDLRDTPAPFKDSIAEITWFNFSNRNCVALRSSRSS